MAGNKRSRFPAYLLLPALFFTGLAVSALLDRLPMASIFFFAAVSLLTLAIYYLDKSAARHGARRIPESTLHALSLAGGWPGAIIAQQRFRHKTQKQPFRFIFWLTVLVNVGTLVWLHTPDGSMFTQQILTLASDISSLASLD